MQNNTVFPFNCWMELLGQTSARGYLAWQWAVNQGERHADEENFQYDWPEAVAWTDQLIAVYGKGQVESAVAKVRAAQQSTQAHSVTGADLGLKPCNIEDAVYILLAKANPDRFAQLLMAQMPEDKKAEAPDLATL